MKLKYALIAAVFAAINVGGWYWWRAYQLDHSQDEVIIAAASIYDMDPALIKAVIWRESRFNPDARGAAAAFSADAPEWRGRLQGRFDDEEIRGSIANDDGGTKVSFASSAPEAARSSLAMLEALDDAGQESLAGARFNSPRVASLDASITIPESGQTFLVRNRRIESVLTSGESGSRRVDVLEWESTEDQRHLPTRVLVTEFDATGAIKGVAILKTEFSLQNGVQVPTSHSGTMIDGPSAASLFSLQVNDVAIKDS